MRVVIAGGHGKIALHLTQRLSVRDDEVVGLIRKPEQAADVSVQGGEPRLCDLERAGVSEIAAILTGASATIFAAGAGPGSGPERKLTVDRDGAIKLLHAAREAGTPRYLMISSVGAEDPPDGEDVFSVYLRAKAAADQALQASDRDWTIVRPGPLTDAPGGGRVRIALEPFRSEVPREDVAGVLEALLHDVRVERRILYLAAGDETVDQALQRVAHTQPP